MLRYYVDTQLGYQLLSYTELLLGIRRKWDSCILGPLFSTLQQVRVDLSIALDFSFWATVIWSYRSTRLYYLSIFGVVAVNSLAILNKYAKAKKWRNVTNQDELFTIADKRNLFIMSFNDQLASNVMDWSSSRLYHFWLYLSELCIMFVYILRMHEWMIL